jgi:hypothetical protein
VRGTAVFLAIVVFSTLSVDSHYARDDETSNCYVVIWLSIVHGMREDLLAAKCAGEGDNGGTMPRHEASQDEVKSQYQHSDVISRGLRH